MVPFSSSSPFSPTHPTRWRSPNEYEMMANGPAGIDLCKGGSEQQVKRRLGK